MAFHIDRIAVHFVDKSTRNYTPSHDELDITMLDPKIREFLTRLIEEVWEEPEKGNITSARFSGAAAEGLLQNIQAIIDDPDNLLEASDLIGRRLYDRSPGNASPGLLAIIRIVDDATGRVHVGLIKIQREPKQLIGIDARLLTTLTVEDLPNLLLEKVQKGAIYPHPRKVNYDIKLVDKQDKDVAIYFREGFLGCAAKKSDESQSKKLLPTLERYSKIRELPFNRARLPRLVSGMIRQNRDITTEFVALQAQEVELFGPELDRADLVTFVRDESGLGDVDIPSSIFERRGQEGYRKMVIKFRRPYDGLIISAPIEIIEDLFVVQGDVVVFNVSTGINAYEVTWE